MIEHHFPATADVFDQDYGVSQPDYSMQETSVFSGYDSPLAGSFDFFDYPDPLKHAFQHQFEPFTLDIGHSHFVKPHFVEGYTRADGTLVEGYYRDGDGDPSINRTVEQGGGYVRSNPDGVEWNNLK